MTPSGYELSKYKKIAACSALVSTVGSVVYFYYKMEQSLNAIINTNVLDIDKKRPDYIYLKYSIYKESLAEIKHSQTYDKNWINIFINPLGKWWKSLKHSVAWRLLEVAKSDDKHQRMKAIHQLARIDHLKDWDFQHLAQQCNATSAVSLARNNCDLRWFLPPRAERAVRQPKSLIYELRDQIAALQPNKCVNFFHGTVLNKFNILKGFEYDDQWHPLDKCKVSKQETEFLKQCLEVLIHLTKEADVVRTLINERTLETLMEVQKLFHKNLEMKFLLAKVISNMSLVACDDFFVTGWVGILAEWSRNPDLRVQVTAAKALNNMDHDDNIRCTYPSRIYPLHPKTQLKRRPDVDIVFVHGLLGGVFVTWRQKDRDYPDELGLYDTILYDEEELISTQPAKKPKTILSDIATNELIATLNTSGELNSDWEVVFPDCPLYSKNDSFNGPYSIIGDKWKNDDRSEEYTYCWPMDWLPFDCPNLRIIGINYETALTEWQAKHTCTCEKGRGTLKNRSDELMKSLADAGLGKDRPIVWVGHSMGGLLIKEIIVQAMNDSNEDIKKLALNTRGILFLGTPHKGSSVAKLKQHIQFLLSPTIEVKELEENGSFLLSLHDKFVDYLHEMNEKVNIVSVVEGSPTMLTSFKFPIRIVTQESAKLQFGDFYVLNVDHLGLSKPNTQQSFLYQRLLMVIKDVLVAYAKENTVQMEHDDDCEPREPH
ncbi:protein SERAC1 isoform X2 [Bradysia coprophila]|uniref:protein SERAC1 isoform X2 n=1 Tax=Bradysia coprophila TaxID=38358 RepID=UPI00187D75FC|nr:protein SERAC1 isoform X2 [Bradysia coprophila]